MTTAKVTVASVYSVQHLVSLQLEMPLFTRCIESVADEPLMCLNFKIRSVYCGLMHTRNDAVDRNAVPYQSHTKYPRVNVRRRWLVEKP